MATDAEGRSALYTSVTFVTDDDGEGFAMWWAITIPVMILLVVGIVYLIIRNSQLTKELQVEMGDIPKSKAYKISTSGSMPSTRSHSSHCTIFLLGYSFLLVD